MTLLPKKPVRVGSLYARPLLLPRLFAAAQDPLLVDDVEATGAAEVVTVARVTGAWDGNLMTGEDRTTSEAAAAEDAGAEVVEDDSTGVTFTGAEA